MIILLLKTTVLSLKYLINLALVVSLVDVQPFLYEGIWYPHLLRRGLSRPPYIISKTVDPTSFNFGRQLGLSMKGKKLVDLMM